MVDLAIAGKPQIIRNGADTLVMLSAEMFERLSQRKLTLEELLLVETNLSDFDLSRDQSAERGSEWEER